MHFSLITLFPEFFDSPLACGMLGRSIASGQLGVRCINPRHFVSGSYQGVDDRPYGGGPGMVMQCEPLVRAIESIGEPGRILVLSPRGRPLCQSLLAEFSREKALTLLCGRYEGIDERIFSLVCAEEVSVGDFVLNGGEAGALCLLEAVARLLPGFMGSEESGREESFSRGLLEYPHYTRPAQLQGLEVPAVLTSGNHAHIARWRQEKALEKTFLTRPELLREAALCPEEISYLQTLCQQHRPAVVGKNLYVALVHGPVLNKSGKTVTVSLTNLDIHDIARLCRTENMGGYFVVTPLADQRALLDRLLAHWLDGPGSKANADRTQALSLVRPVSTVEEATEAICHLTGQRPFVVATSAQMQQCVSFSSVRQRLVDRPVLLLLGTGSGLAPELMKGAHAILPPIRFAGEYNHLSVRCAAAILIDRLLGDIL